MKLAFVVQRYGLEVNGGSEQHCRWIAERMSKYFEVEVLTTCAIDYMTWKNEYPEGLCEVNGIKIRRFNVDKERDVKSFNMLSEKIFFNRPHTIKDEEEWMDRQGPYAPKLIQYLRKNKDNYDFIIFFTYLYYTTYNGIQVAPEKSILVPTAHDEPAVYLKIFEKVFTSPTAIVYNTDTEKNFINQRFKNDNITSVIIALGAEMSKNTDEKSFTRKYKIKDDFIVYVGRVDESKGCNELIEYFTRYKKETKSDIKLALIGREVMKVPENPDIINTGFIPDEEKANGIKASTLLVVPSLYESLSYVMLEAWLLDKPVLVNGKCTVMKDQCIKSNGGLYYENYDEFKYSLNLLLTNSKTREKLASNGKKYTEENYSWQTVEKKYTYLLKNLKNKHKKLKISEPFTLEELECIYRNSVLKQEFYNADYAAEWQENAEPKMVMARYIKDILTPESVLDVGCGIGQLIHQLREYGIDAYGLEYSKSFISISPVKKYLHQGDVSNLKRFKDKSFDLVVCMEVLEHIPPTYLNTVISELKRIAKKSLLVTIPSYGPDESGYCGLPLNEECWLKDAKDNAPFKNLVVDEQNLPDCGHITLASYKWWTDKFLKNGLIREVSSENVGYKKYDFLKYRWNTYILNKLAENKISAGGDNFFSEGFYNIENLGDETGPARWTKKEFTVYLNITKKYRILKLKFFSSPREIVFNRSLDITTHLLREDDNQKLWYEEKNTKSILLEPDKWYDIELSKNSELTGTVKFTFKLNKDFTPEHLIKNGDTRQLGILFTEIRIIY